MKRNDCSSSLRRILESDSGMALAVVMLMSVILFILAETVIMIPSYRQLESASAIQSNTSRQVAEVGLNEYMEQLRRSYSFNDATVGPYSSDGGTWIVYRSVSPSGTVKLKSISTLANGTHWVLETWIRFPSWAKYIVLVDEGPYSIGTGATFFGDVHSNNGISNSGVITGMASTVTGKTMTYGTSAAVNYPGGREYKPLPINFGTVVDDLAAMKTSALSSSAYYAPSGQLGYSLELNGTQATIYKVSAVNKSRGRPTDTLLGTLTKTLVGTAIIPSQGVMFFDDDVWVTGNYGAGITVASSKNIWCPGNIQPSNTTSNLTCGLVAEQQILFPYWYETMPDNQVVQAALLSRTAGVGPDAPSGLLNYTYNSTTKTWVSSSYTAPYNSSVTIKGARAMVRMIGFSSGYNTRNFDKDPTLANTPPPMYPKLPGEGLAFSSWTERAYDPTGLDAGTPAP